MVFEPKMEILDGFHCEVCGYYHGEQNARRGDCSNRRRLFILFVGNFLLFMLLSFAFYQVLYLDLFAAYLLITISFLSILRLNIYFLDQLVKDDE